MEIIDKIKKLWDERGYEIILGLCIAFILIFSLYRKITGGRGTWSTKYQSPYQFDKKNVPDQQPNRYQPPRESKGETECRRVLEYLFKRPFGKERPDFLRNPVTNGSFNLELDCYNRDLQIAVEYNGEQHYKYIPFFHRNKDSFTNQKYRDELKRRMCRDNGVVLIEVPYTIKLEGIKEYLEKELRKVGYQF